MFPPGNPFWYSMQCRCSPICHLDCLPGIIRVITHACLPPISDWIFNLWYYFIDNAGNTLHLPNWSYRLHQGLTMYVIYMLYMHDCYVSPMLWHDVLPEKRNKTMLPICSSVLLSDPNNRTLKCIYLISCNIYISNTHHISNSHHNNCCPHDMDEKRHVFSSLSWW